MMAGKYAIPVFLALCSAAQASVAGVVAPFAKTYNAHSIQHAVAYPAAPAVSTVHVPLPVATPSKVTFGVPGFATTPTVVVNAPAHVPFGAVPAVIDTAPSKVGFAIAAFTAPVAFSSPAYGAFAAANYGIATAPLAFGLHPGGIATTPIQTTPPIATPAPVAPALAAPTLPTSPVAPSKLPLSSSIFSTPGKTPTTFAAHNAPYFL